MSDFCTKTTIVSTIHYPRAVFVNGVERNRVYVVINVDKSLDDFLQSQTDDAIDFLYFWKAYPKPSFYWAVGGKEVQVLHHFTSSLEQICRFTTQEVAPPYTPPLEETYSQYMRRTRGKLVEN